MFCWLKPQYKSTIHQIHEIPKKSSTGVVKSLIQKLIVKALNQHFFHMKSPFLDDESMPFWMTSLGKYGWIKPTVPVEHPMADRHKVRLNKAKRGAGKKTGHV